ncbi:hypothetical protein DIURU_004292 [Diutina rugosa]|uniref:Uncharacterized protein n=1 Tax=Diutina rugosa TaxID=5481 RepID=A0A642UK86_DIURU|nr:uncharacterized protein DIURU_004292 [Diutina rugosa]KAA8899450.1 hypothetical protein DIURU_004292 [Diutina rugosa]
MAFASVGASDYHGYKFLDVMCSTTMSDEYKLRYLNRLLEKFQINPPNSRGISGYLRGLVKVFELNLSLAHKMAALDLVPYLVKDGPASSLQSRLKLRLITQIAQQRGPVVRGAAEVLATLWDDGIRECKMVLMDETLEVSAYIANALLPRILDGTLIVASGATTTRVGHILTVASTLTQSTPAELLEQHGGKLVHAEKEAIQEVLPLCVAATAQPNVPLNTNESAESAGASTEQSSSSVAPPNAPGYNFGAVLAVPFGDPGYRFGAVPSPLDSTPRQVANDESNVEASPPNPSNPAGEGEDCAQGLKRSASTGDLTQRKVKRALDRVGGVLRDFQNRVHTENFKYYMMDRPPASSDTPTVESTSAPPEAEPST